MGRFTNGLLLGIGAGLLLAPMRGEEMRRLVGERISRIRASLFGSGQGNQYIQQTSDTLSQTANALKSDVQQAAAEVQSAGSTVAEKTRQAAIDVQQTSQNVAETTKQAAQTPQPNTRRTDGSF